MDQNSSRQKTVVIGAGPVGALAALYAAQRGDDVEIYELRGGTCRISILHIVDWLRDAYQSWIWDAWVFIMSSDIVAQVRNFKPKGRIIGHPIRIT